MGLFGKRNINLFRKIKNKKKKYGWKITDTILKAEEFIPNQCIEYNGKLNIDSEKRYVCIRTYNSTCIYVPEGQLDNFKNIGFLYSKDENLVNISVLKRHIVNGDIFASISVKSVPNQVVLKEIQECKIKNITIYLYRIIKLQQSDQLFEDLVNIRLLKNRHNLK